MAPTSLQWKRQRSLSLLNGFSPNPSSKSLERSLQRSKAKTFSKRFSKGRKRRVRLPYYLGLTFLMLLWDWKILLATLMGIGTVFLLPILQRYRWQPLLQVLHQLWRSPNRPFLLSVAGGGLMATLAYISAQIWIETQSHWLAAGVILQGIVMTLMLAIGASSLFHRITTQSEETLYQNLSDLTHTEPITRLIAIHRLTTLARQGQLNPAQTQVISDAFTLFLNQEPENKLRHAVLDGLNVLRP